MLEKKPDAKTAKSAARPYAKAAFEVAQKEGKVAEWEDRLGKLVAALEQVGEPLLRNPAITAEQTREVMGHVMDKLGMTKPEKNFINILIDNKRLSLLPWIHEEFVEARKLDSGITDVRIITAFELEPKQLEKLTQSIEKKFNIKAAPTVEIDKDLIGGVKIVIGDMVYDDSIKGKLEALKKHLEKPPGGP